MNIRFPGGLRVDAEEGGFRILTDQPRTHGGGGTAPSPFDLFLASIGTCAGFYALRFCQQRGLSTRGLSLSLEAQRDAEAKRVVRVVLAFELPEGFPEKYRDAIRKAVDQCSVKRHLAAPPEIVLVVDGAALPENAAPERSVSSPLPN
jgi:ribosomal protein S12 methylthiotransferase accessory factor